MALDRTTLDVPKTCALMRLAEPRCLQMFDAALTHIREAAARETLTVADHDA